MTTASSDRRALLLDVGTLLALAWPNHQFHGAVVRRLERRPLPAWATCALSQLGFVRLSSNPAVVNVRKTPAEAVAILAGLTRDRRHRYLDRLPPLPAVGGRFDHLLGHQQVTDAYLVAVAAANEAVLVTLDHRLSSGASAGHVEVIAP